MLMSILTGHSFRRSSATFLANSGATIERLMRHGRWSSMKIAERYVDSSLEYKRDTGNIFADAIAPKKARTTATTSTMVTSSRHQTSSSSACTVVSSQVCVDNVGVENVAVARVAAKSVRENVSPKVSSQGFDEHIGNDDPHADIEDLRNLSGITALQEITDVVVNNSKVPSAKRENVFNFHNCDITFKLK